jgi:hypothetical protein
LTLNPTGGQSLNTSLANAGTVNYVTNGTINIAAGKTFSNSGTLDLQCSRTH